MPQARTLKEAEIKKVLQLVSLGRNAARNRAMLLISFGSGMRVGEIAALKIGDVIESDGSVKTEIWLKPEQTKGKRGRKVIFGEKLRKEIRIYLDTLKKSDAQQPLIYSQRNRDGFEANNFYSIFIVLICYISFKLNLMVNSSKKSFNVILSKCNPRYDCCEISARIRRKVRREILRFINAWFGFDSFNFNI